MANAPQRTTCCIVGAGPAGVTLSLFLARAGVRVTLLEAHRDFDRDFRGDTIHPATLEVLDQIGLEHARTSCRTSRRAPSGSCRARPSTKPPCSAGCRRRSPTS